MFGGAYAWANFTILALGVWAVAQRDSLDAISMVSRGGCAGPGCQLIWGPCSGCPAPVPACGLLLSPMFASQAVAHVCVPARPASLPAWLREHRMGSLSSRRRAWGGVPPAPWAGHAPRAVDREIKIPTPYSLPRQDPLLGGDQQRGNSTTW